MRFSCLRLPTVLGALVAAGCYSPTIPSGAQQCSPDRQCADGLACAWDNHCYPPGMAPAMPGAMPDLAMPGTTADLMSCTMVSCAAPTPVCDPGSGQCVACLIDSQCGDGTICKMQKCVPGCSAQKSCGDAGVCDVNAGVCTTCKSDLDCKDPKALKCNLATGFCQGCLAGVNDSCPLGGYCAAQNGIFACQSGCKADNDCVQIAMQKPDAGAPDLAAPPDMAQGASPDMAMFSDGGMVVDLGAPPDLLPPADLAPPPVPMQLACCNHVCSNVLADSANCGACGKACGGGLACCGGGCADTTKDLANCGGCGKACAGNHAMWSCANSTCAVSSCVAPYLNCDNDAVNGCEVNSFTDANNCLQCGKVCGVPNGVASCAMNGCSVGGCKPGFADCDGSPVNGCEINTNTDVLNCGACKMACANVPNGAGGCALGKCGVGQCNPGFGDCDKLPGNGCEATLASDPMNCKSCGNSCAMLPNGVGGCANSACTVASCTGTFKDCNNNAVDGCEANTATDPANCKACGMKCPAVQNGMPGCAAGVCGVGTCSGAFKDCDGIAANGCETDTSSDPLNCKACNVKCPAVQNGLPGCANGACGIGSCTSGFKDCNNNAADGCETNVASDKANCGACNMACGGNLRCASGMCVQGCFDTNDVAQGGLGKSQFTSCSAVQGNGFTCLNPLIRYGNVPDGVPSQHPNNDFATWCKELGCNGYVANSVVYGNRSYAAPFGKLFWCTGYDDPAPHWCDWQDGTWYNQQLDYHVAPDALAITSITCN